MSFNFKALSIAASVTFAAVGAIAIRPAAAQAQRVSFSGSELSYLADYDRLIKTTGYASENYSIFGTINGATNAINMGYNACRALDRMTVAQFSAGLGDLARSNYSDPAEIRMFVAIGSTSMNAAIYNLCPQHVREYETRYGDGGTYEQEQQARQASY